MPHVPRADHRDGDVRIEGNLVKPKGDVVVKFNLEPTIRQRPRTTKNAGSRVSGQKLPAARRNDDGPHGSTSLQEAQVAPSSIV